MATIRNPSTVAAPAGKYSHSVEVGPNARWLTISGQIGVQPDGTVAEGFEAQCRTAFNNLLAILADAGMGPEDVVKQTVFLIRREDLSAYRTLRDEAMGDCKPASTLLFVAGLASSDFLVEIEMTAAKEG
jgi:enamine deaminase RidA (YjgF/YER057c/UK114 family)